mmetsp:Transcript_56401/g.168804  ORF Transcript_56401/g.168804 Transcript_56401/m.168804 type:complete len:220 (+) Transcript_56401:679-1338(+)
MKRHNTLPLPLLAKWHHCHPPPHLCRRNALYSTLSRTHSTTQSHKSTSCGCTRRSAPSSSSNPDTLSRPRHLPQERSRHPKGRSSFAHTPSRACPCAKRAWTCPFRCRRRRRRCSTGGCTARRMRACTGGRGHVGHRRWRSRRGRRDGHGARRETPHYNPCRCQNPETASRMQKRRHARHPPSCQLRDGSLLRADCCRSFHRALPRGEGGDKTATSTPP